MNLNLIRPKNQKEDLLVSITKNCEMLIEQTQWKAEETLEFKLNKSKEIFPFNPPITIKGSWMVGLTNLEVYNSIFNINATNNKFELYTDTFDEISPEELKVELGEIPNISDITPYHLRHEKTGPRLIKASSKERLEKSSTDGCILLLMGYARSPFWDLATYLRIVVGLDGDEIQLKVKRYNSNFVIYELSPGFYTSKDVSEAVVYTIGDHEGGLQIEYDDASVKKLILTRFGGNFGKLRFDERSFLNNLMGFKPYWNDKPNIANHVDSPGVYTSDKTLDLRTIDKIHLKCVVTDGSIANGLQNPIVFSFVLDKSSGYKVFCEPETNHYKKGRILFGILWHFI